MAIGHIARRQAPRSPATPMSVLKLDGIGTEKLKTLDDAMQHLQHLHGLVERMALAVRGQQPTTALAAQFKRTAGILVGLLKGQFSLISDQVASLLLIASRGGGEQAKIRALREGVAQTRAQVEIAMAKVKEKHGVDSKPGGEPPGTTRDPLS